MADWDQGSSPHRFSTFVRQHLLLLCELRAESKDPRAWALYPKHHLLIHIAEGAIVNPRLEWNYGDESEIGSAVALAANTNVVHLATQLLERYRVTFEMPR